MMTTYNFLKSTKNQSVRVLLVVCFGFAMTIVGCDSGSKNPGEKTTQNKVGTGSK